MSSHVCLSRFHPEHHPPPPPPPPERVHGEVWVVRFLSVQGDHAVPAHEDVGAPLDGGHRRARYHPHPHAVVAVHHRVSHLHLTQTRRRTR